MKKIVALIVFIILIFGYALADEMFILCKPKTEVNVRLFPKWGAEVIGHKYCGDVVYTDGRRKNGFLHVYDLGFENMEGWIYSGILVEYPPMLFEGKDQITSSGRVAARQYIGGKRNKWLKAYKDVVVYAVSKEWSITDQGYVKTKYLSVNYQIPQQKD